MFGVTVRILDRTMTEALWDRSSSEYRDFSQQLLREVKPRAGTVSSPSGSERRVHTSLLSASPSPFMGDLLLIWGQTTFEVHAFDSNGLHHSILHGFSVQRPSRASGGPGFPLWSSLTEKALASDQASAPPCGYWGHQHAARESQAGGQYSLSSDDKLEKKELDQLSRTMKGLRFYPSCKLIS